MDMTFRFNGSLRGRCCGVPSLTRTRQAPCPTTARRCWAGSGMMQEGETTAPSCPTDVAGYLRDRLALQVDENRVARLKVAELAPNVELLLEMQSVQRVSTLLSSHPELLGVELRGWQNFLLAYGISTRFFLQLLRTNPDLFIHGSLFTAGQNMMFLQSLGLTSRDIAAHVIPRAPEVLCASLHATLMPVVSFLSAPPQPPASTATSSAEHQEDSGEGSSRSTSSTGTASSGTPSDAPAVNPSTSAGTPVMGPGTPLPPGIPGVDGDEGGSWGLGLSPDQVRSILSRCPRVLLMSAGRELRPRVRLLREGLGLSQDEVQRMLYTNASLLVSPLEPQLHTHLSFLTSVCGFSADQARRVLVDCTELPVLSLSNLQRKWVFLTQSVYGPATRTAIAHVAATAAVVAAAGAGGREGALGVVPAAAAVLPTPSSAAAPAATSHVATAAAGNPAGAPSASPAPPSQAEVAARAGVLAYPTALGKSLLGDMGPRFCFARDRGLLDHLLDYNPQMGGVSLCLRKLLEPDTQRFVAAVHGDEDDFQSYVAAWRRNEAGRLTVTSGNIGESSW